MFRRSLLRALLVIPVLAGGFLAAGCQPVGEGRIELLESRFLSHGPTKWGPAFSMGRGTHRAHVHTGSRFSAKRGSNGRWNLDLYLSVPAYRFTVTLGGPEGFDCVTLVKDHVRCSQRQDDVSINAGKHEITVDFKKDRIAGVLVRELSPPSYEWEVLGTEREKEWPKNLLRFRDDRFSWSDPTLAGSSKAR